MKKEELITRYGEEAYKRKLERERSRYNAHREEQKARSKKYREEHREEEEYRQKKKAQTKRYNEEHPEEVIANNQEASRKGGRRYDKHLEYNLTGLRGARNRIRNKHRREYQAYKVIIAPDSQLHHEWVPTTAEYRGIALVEAEQHMHGFIDVIQILDGKITLLTEEEVKRGEEIEKNSLQAG